MSDTRILPIVGERYISRRNDVVVEVVRVTHDGGTTVWYVDTKEPNCPHCYNLDWFWERYKSMEEEDVK